MPVLSCTELGRVGNGRMFSQQPLLPQFYPKLKKEFSRQRAQECIVHAHSSPRKYYSNLNRFVSSDYCAEGTWVLPQMTSSGVLPAACRCLPRHLRAPSPARNNPGLAPLGPASDNNSVLHLANHEDRAQECPCRRNVIFEGE